MTSATSGVKEPNKFGVTYTVGGNIVVGGGVMHSLSPDEALVLAAWLSTLALKAGGNFEKYVDLCERLEEQHGK